MRKRTALPALGALTAVVAGTLGVLAGPAGAAGTETYRSEIPETKTQWGPQTLSVSKFDPALGVLDHVTVELGVSVTADGKVENTSPRADTRLTLILGGELELETPQELIDLGFPTLVTAERSEATPLPAYDGDTDFVGPSGRQLIDIKSSETYSATFTDPAQFGPFVGLGALEIPAAAYATSLARAGGNVDSQFTTQLGTTLSVTYSYKTPGISITKDPKDQLVTPGGNADFNIKVSNIGETPLSNVTVTDPQAPGCDKLIGELPVGEATEYLCSMIDVQPPAPNSQPPGTPPGVVINTATVTGQTGSTTVTDTDSAPVRVGTPAISVTKRPATQTIKRGETATFAIVVTNTGSLDLTDVVVADAQAPKCAATIPALAVAASASIDCVLDNVTADFTNTVIVTGQSAGGPVTDTASAEVIVTQPQPAIDIEKFVNGDDADIAPGVSAEIGAPLVFSFVVSNTGDDALSDVIVLDDVLGAITCPAAALAPDESMTCTPVTQSQVGFAVAMNTARVTGVGTTGTTVTDADVAYHHGVRSDVCPADQDMAMNLRFQVNNGPQLSSLEGVVAKPGDVITVTWDAYAPDAEGCQITLAQHKTTTVHFDPSVEQPLIQSVSCTNNDCKTADGFELKMTVIDTDGPNQFDLVTGPAKSSVGPLGGFYSSILNGGTNRLIFAGTSAGN